MRGKVFRSAGAAFRAGITPAYAGKSRLLRQGLGPRQDHPRVCGEKAPSGAALSSGTGSPPRMRGKDPPGPVMRITGGITPAYAGKSGLSSKNILQVEDHPRVCGEKAAARAGRCCCWGSPPRMRGKALRPHTSRMLHRITPAYAGKRSAWPPVLRRQRDHPRVCGEK